jgi:hypothetical protein
VNLDLSVAVIALAIVKARRQEYANHDEYVATFVGTGYRPARCIHGASLWVDHDIPCGRCEDGDGHYDYLRVASEAISDARMLIAEHERRKAAYWAVHAVDPNLPLLGDLLSWVCEPISAAVNRGK